MWNHKIYFKLNVNYLDDVILIIRINVLNVDKFIGESYHRMNNLDILLIKYKFKNKLIVLEWIGTSITINIDNDKKFD